jgi:serine phosphatase RsbU (regulator of sigma subunit)
VNVRKSGSEGADFVSAVASAGDALPADLIDDAPVGLGLLDAQSRWVYVNAQFLRATGLDRAQILGRPVAATPFAADAAVIRRILAEDHFRDEVVDGAAGAVGGAAATGWHVSYRRLESGGRLVGVTAAVAGTVPEQVHQLDRARRRLAAQVAAAERIGTTLEIDVTCQELAEFTVPAMSDLTIVEVMPYEITDRGDGAGSVPPRMRRAAFACSPSIRRRLGSADLLGKPTRSGEGSAVAQALQAGGPVAANLLSADELERLAGSELDAAAYRAAGIDSLLTAPLIARGRIVGTLTMARAGGKRRGFTEDDIVLVQDLADRAAVSVENARQYAESQRMTLELQRALLVEPGPPHGNLEIAARYLPLGGRNLVGGDWYEIIRLPFGRTLLVMADVMGHGMEAAVDMSTYRSIIRELGGMDIPPNGILAHLDAVIAEKESARPATCLLAVADPNRGRWTLASAGHLPPALFAAGRPTELIRTPIGPPLGTGVGGYDQVTVDLLPEQILLLYTDGLVERRGEDIDISLARLASVAFPPTGGLEQLLHVVLRALASATPDDDIAVLAARAHPDRAARRPLA